MSERTDNDGQVRQSYYGDGRQPWDDILEQGWGPAFSAGNVLKYLRRTKEPEKDLVKAKWYYKALKTLNEQVVIVNLNGLLTEEEKGKLND